MASRTITDWEIAKTYAKNDLVFLLEIDSGSGVPSDIPQLAWPQESDQIYRCEVAHTAAAFHNDYVTNHYWVAVKGEKGSTGSGGSSGAKGEIGATGATGSSGSNGSTGSDGIFSEIASQAEAQAGTNNTKGMSPLRVQQAIAQQAPTDAEITALQVVDTGLATSIAATNLRVSRLETVVPNSVYAGSQRILNNQSTAKAILGLTAPSGDNGRGNMIRVDADGTKHARFTLQIYRIDDAEERLVSVTLILMYIGTTWYMARERTTLLEGDEDGLTFSIQQTSNWAQVYYVSDNMTGGNYKITSRISYTGKEIAVGV